MTDLIITEALGSAIQQHEDDIERYRLLIAQRAQHEGPQAILSLVYGWHVAAGIVQALRQVRDTDRTAPTPGPLDGQEPLIEDET